MTQNQELTTLPPLLALPDLDEDMGVPIVALLVIDGVDQWLSRDEIALLSNRLVRTFGVKNFHVGRETPGDNDPVLRAMEDLPPLPKSVLTRHGVEQALGHAGWLGNERLFIAPTKAEQIIKINIKGPAFTEEAPVGDWPLVAMIFDWVKAMGLECRIYFGADSAHVPLREMTPETRDRIHHKFLMEGRSPLIEMADGSRKYLDAAEEASVSWPWVVQCHVCSTAMEYRGEALTIAGEPSGMQEHSCPGCGENMNLDVSEDGDVTAYWLGSKRLRRTEGPVRLLSRPDDVEIPDSLADFAPLSEADADQMINAISEWGDDIAENYLFNRVEIQ